MERTADPEVMIESRLDGQIVYRRSDGKRWKVTGKCERLGLCLVGAVINGTFIESVEQLKDIAGANGRPDSVLDVPVGPNFSGCCPLKVEILE